MIKDGRNGLQETNIQSQGWGLKSLWNWFGLASGTGQGNQSVPASPPSLALSKDPLPQPLHLYTQNYNQDMRKRI